MKTIFRGGPYLAFIFFMMALFHFMESSNIGKVIEKYFMILIAFLFFAGFLAFYAVVIYAKVKSKNKLKLGANDE